MNAGSVGWRFSPKDDELINYFLRRKINGKEEDVRVIKEVDICKCEPWDLPGQSVVQSDDKEWFFFSPLDKVSGGSRQSRATCKGFWKATGKDRKIKYKKNEIGMKKTLVFHTGRAPNGKRTFWVMHEYRTTLKELDGTHPGQRPFILFKLFKKDDESVEKLHDDDTELATTPIPSEQLSPMDCKPQPVPYQVSPATGQESEQQLSLHFNAADVINNMKLDPVEVKTLPPTDEVFDYGYLFADPNPSDLSLVDSPMTEGTTSFSPYLAADSVSGNSNTDKRNVCRSAIRHLPSHDSCGNSSEDQNYCSIPAARSATLEPQYETPGTDCESFWNETSEADMGLWVTELEGIISNAESSAPSQIIPSPDPVNIMAPFQELNDSQTIPEYHGDAIFGGYGLEEFQTSVQEERNSLTTVSGPNHTEHSGIQIRRRQPELPPAIGNIDKQGTAIRRLRYQINLQMGELQVSSGPECLETEMPILTLNAHSTISLDNSNNPTLDESDEASRSMTLFKLKDDEQNSKDKLISSVFSRIKLIGPVLSWKLLVGLASMATIFVASAIHGCRKAS